MYKNFLNTIKAAVIVVAFTLANQSLVKAADATTAFEKLKSLQGTWLTNGQNPAEKEVSYEVIADGSAVLERTGGMVTVYHLNGNTLMATHYCEAHNQPRFVADNFENENLLTFKFLDVTNANDGYINGIKFEFQDADHITVYWSYIEKSTVSEFNMVMTRKK